MGLLTRFLALGGSILFVFWLYLVVRCRVSNDSKVPIKELIIRSKIEASLAGILVYFIYIFVFFHINGWQRFTWGEWGWKLSENIYGMLIPEELIFISLVVCFFVNMSKLSKLYNK